MHAMDHEEWIRALEDGVTPNAAAKKAGVDPSTVSRQLKRGGLSPEVVIALSRAYGKKAGDELVRTGFLEPADIEGVGVESALRLATSRQMLDEIDRRMSDGGGADLNVKPSERG